MFGQVFKNIDDVIWKEAVFTTELDYIPRECCRPRRIEPFPRFLLPQMSQRGGFSNYANVNVEILLAGSLSRRHRGSI